MKKNVVIKKLHEATDERGRLDLNLLDPEVAKQVTTAYISGERGMLPLYSKEAVANFYETSETIVSHCIDYSIEYGRLKFGLVRKVSQHSADNERRHAEHRGLTKSEKRYATLIQKRFEHYKADFEKEENRKIYDAAYKMYLGQSTLKKVMGTYGFSEEEMRYLLIRKACIDMSSVEFGIFMQKFYQDFLGTPMYHRSIEFINSFRKNMSKQISQMQKLRAKGQKDTKEYKAFREELVKHFESFK